MTAASLLREIREYRHALERARMTSEPTASDRTRYDWTRLARPSQRLPEGSWTYFLIMTGRGWGKTRTGAETVRQWVRSHRFVNLIGATSDDAREIMIEGESGILEVCPDHERPRYLFHKRRLEWPNGARSLIFSAEEPDRLRGKQHSKLWCDELASWSYPEAWDQAKFGLRLGTSPQAILTTTPRPKTFLRDLIADPGCRLVRGSTHENRDHLAPGFLESITARYQGTKLGLQELEGQLLEFVEGAWFVFSETASVSPEADYDPTRPVVLGIDAGTSRTTGCVFLQTERLNAYRTRFVVFDEHLAVDQFSGSNAQDILAKVLDYRATIAQAWIDPASRARTSIGPAAWQEYAKVFGERLLNPAPSWQVCDGLDMLSGLLERGDLVINPRCKHLIEALKSYQRARSGGQWLDVPAGNQSPHEDMCDALRYAVVGHWPEGRKLPPKLHHVHSSQVF